MNTSYPRCSVGDFGQLATVGVQVTGTSQVRCWQCQQVHYYFQTGGGLEIKTERERKKGSRAT